MTLLIARYDFRLPPGASTPREDLYATALEQARYCEDRGFTALVLSEHHGVDDGYLPSPLVLAAAMASTTSRIAITIAALLVPLHDPLRLAEDMAVLDLISQGRVNYVFGLGYRPEEYAMFGHKWSERGRRMDECIETILQAWTGEPFEYHGEVVRVTPTPVTKPRPMIFYGGGSPPAARRAARLGLNFWPQVRDESLTELYREECRSRQRKPGIAIDVPPGPGMLFVAEDPDAFWERHGEHLLHEALSYSSWQGEQDSLVHDRSQTVEEMRDAGVFAVYSPDELIELCRSGEIGAVMAHPLCGGIPPDASWESLRLIGDVVAPALSS